MEDYKNEPVLHSPLEKINPSPGVTLVIQTLVRARFKVLIAGGAIRDLLLDKPIKDLDLVTDASPESVITELKKIGVNVLPFGQSFGIVAAIIDKEKIEIATFRSEGNYSDGRRPDQVNLQVSPYEDAQRRDLTINGLFYDPIENIIIDYVGGTEDLVLKQLKFIGNPTDRINEDHLRLLRFVRFQLKTGFKPDEASQYAIRECAHLVTTVSGERIKAELDTMFSIGPVSKALELLKDYGLLKHVLPEIDALSACKSDSSDHPESNVFAHTTLLADYLPDTASLDVKWAAILHEIAKPITRQESTDSMGNKKVSFPEYDSSGAEMAEKILTRLRFSEEQIRKITWLIKNHQRINSFADMDAVNAKRFALNTALTEVNPNFNDLLILAQAGHDSSQPKEPDIRPSIDKIIERYKEIQIQLQTSTPMPQLISGADIMTALRLKKGGPQVGKMLRATQDRILANPGQVTREQALSILQDVIRDFAEE